MTGITVRFSVRAAIVVAVAALAGISCGSVTAPPLSAMEACGDLAQAMCDKRNTCTNGAGITRVNGDMASCLVEEQQMCMLALAAPDTGGSPDNTKKCVAAIGGWSCTDFLNGSPPVACTPAGTRPTSMPCTFNGQCGSAFCLRDKTSVCGTCQAPPSIGDACLDGNCAHGQTCVGNPKTCQALVAVGQPCTGATCSAGLNCVGTDAINMGAGTCEMAGATVGTACGTGTPQCAGVLGLACSGSGGSKTCMMITYGNDGAACGPSTADVVRALCKAGGCYTASGQAAEADTGTCKADVDPGSACDTMLGPACKPPGRCVVVPNSTAGTCMTPDPSICG